MSKIRRTLPDFQGVLAGQRATNNLPVGATYEMLFIEYKKGGVAATEAEIIADLTKIRLVLDGIAKIDVSAKDLVASHKYFGNTINHGILPVIFARPWARTPMGEDLLAYGTQNIRSATLEVDIASGVVNPSLKASAITGAPSNLGYHVTMLTHTKGFSGTGQKEISDLPKGLGRIQLTTHIASAQVTAIEVEADAKRVWEGTREKDEVTDALFGKIFQPNYYHINYVANDRLANLDKNNRLLTNGLSLNLQDYRFKMQFSAPDNNFNIVQENIEMGN